MTKQRLLRLARASSAFWLVLLLLGACGPVTTASTIGDAERELKEARALDAEKNAPYEYTKAAAFLHKSKELQGYGLYEQSSTYARRSRLMAEKAIDVARLSAERQKRTERFDKGQKKPAVPGFTPSSE